MVGRRFCTAWAAIGLTVACAAAPTVPPSREPAAATSATPDDSDEVEALRRRVLAEDDVAELEPDDGDSSRLRAWKVCAAARSKRIEDARAWADAIDVGDPWSTFARGCLLHVEESDEALVQTAWGLKGLDGHEDIVWLRALVLADRRERDAVIELHRTARPRLRDPMAAELDLVLAEALAARDWEQKDGSLTQALQLAADVRERIPDHIRAHTRPVNWLSRVRRAAEGLALVEQAAAIAPTNLKVRRQRWGVLLAVPELSAAQRHAKIHPEIAAVLEREGDDPRALYDAAEVLGLLGLPDEREAVWARIERDHADSETADYVAWDRIDVLRDKIRLQKHQQGKADPELVAEVKRRVRRATAPEHRPAFWRGRAYITWFSLLVEDGDAVNAAELLEAVEGMAAHDKDNLHVVYALGPRLLAERTPHVQRALELVELGFEKAGDHHYHDDDERRYARVELHLAKAAILVEAKRFDEADRSVAVAAGIAGADVRIPAARGAIAERRGDQAGAQRHYVECLAMEANALRRPCSEAIERFYLAEHGGRRGLKRHMARLQADAKATRKAAILAERIEEDRSVKAFELRSLKGGSVASESLRDKVAVVHFWATWCGACVLEMKAIAELERKYSTHKDVEVVLVSGDANPDQLQRWLAEHGFAFDTLLEDGYAHEAGIKSWPTTLFLDRSGRIRYEHRGATSDLVEEFSWRIDALRRGGE